MGRRRYLSAAHRHAEEPTVNLTPLIDVVFVILIMFILIAPILELENVNLADAGDHPGQETVAVQENSPIVIHVQKNNKIIFNNKAVALEQLPQLLRQAKKNFPKAKPQIFHDKQAHFGVYQAIKNAAESAGFQQMDIILKPS